MKEMFSSVYFQPDNASKALVSDRKNEAIDSGGVESENKFKALDSFFQDNKSFLVRESTIDGPGSADLQAVLLGVKPASWVTHKLKDKQIKANGDFGFQNQILFNKKLVIETVYKNKDYFPNDQNKTAEEIIAQYFFDTDPKNGLPGDGRTDFFHIQRGLILGYPREAVESFARNQDKELVGYVVDAGGIGWREERPSVEGEELREKYQKALSDKDFKLYLEEQRKKLHSQ